MTAFRILDQVPVYLDLLGQPASGGTLRFFDNVTDTPKDVFGDPDLTVNNGPTVLIGTDGRTVHDIWGDGVYRVRLYAFDNTLIAEAENVEIPGGAGTAIPALSANKFLTNDGAVMSWVDVLQVPDPTGSGGKILGTDGVNFIWQAPPTIPDLPIVNNPVSNHNSAQIGSLLIQWGNRSLAPNGFRQQADTVNFVEAFETCYMVMVIATTITATAGGQIAVPAVVTKSPGSFAVQFDTDDSGEVNAQFTNNLTYDWIAYGKKAS